MNPDPQPGYVWLDPPGKVLYVSERRVEVQGGDSFSGTE